MGKKVLKIGLITSLLSILFISKIFICLFVLAFNLPEPKGNVNNVKYEYSSSEKFSNEEIEAAMDAVKERFSQGFVYCELLSINYDEEDSNRNIENNLKVYTYTVDYKSKDSNNLIVLSCKFDTHNHGSSAWSPVYPDNTIVTWHKWALTRSDKGSPWEVTGSGML